MNQAVRCSQFGEFRSAWYPIWYLDIRERQLIAVAAIESSHCRRSAPAPLSDWAAAGDLRVLSS